MPKEEATERSLKGARLLALDVDGTLTDGRVEYGDFGEVQRFCVHDGAGLRWLLEADVRVVWITGRGCAATERRAKELEITELVLRGGPKDVVLAAVQDRLHVAPEETIAMGDDLPDLGMRARAALFAAPASARPEVREAADLVTTARGGEGAVRELCELVLRAKGRWSAIVSAAAR